MARQFKTFAELVRDEHRQLSEAQNLGSESETFDTTTEEGTTGEPWLRTAHVDRVGLALSGGGIRSATFNLGLLEALDQRGILSFVDYLSTVSGGGYIGGFWTAWRSRTTEASDNVFPHRNSTDLKQPGDADNRERPETRHLREFSRFLMPRIGVNQPEMWFALATILGGMLPALVVTFAAIFLFYYVWLGIGYLALSSSTSCSVVFGAVTLALHIERRRKWTREHREDVDSSTGRTCSFLYWLLALITTGAAAWLLPTLLPWFHESQHWGWVDTTHFATLGFEPAIAWLALALAVSVGSIFLEGMWRWVETIRIADRDKIRERRLHRSVLRDQLSSRYLAWATVAAAIAAVWQLTFSVANAALTRAHAAGTAGTLTAVFTGLYIWLRDWLTKSDKQSKESGIWRKIAQNLKSFLPMLLASAGALSLLVFALLLMRFYGLGLSFSSAPSVPSAAEVWTNVIWCAGGAVFVILLALKFFDPAFVGLHDFYRGRIARAFLGAAFVPAYEWQSVQKETQAITANLTKVAQKREDEYQQDKAAQADQNLSENQRAKLEQMASRRARQRDYINDYLARFQRRRRSEPSAPDNRYTVERKEDDLCLTCLPVRRSQLDQGLPESVARLRLRPIHLICCAANHLAGDTLATLSRGARSAVLSQRGVSIGDDSCVPGRADPVLMLSAAQTASAAAFNSQMGEKSLRLGPASSFLMTALNLRLGLWVVNPSAQRIGSDQLVYESLTLRVIAVEKLKGNRLRHPWLSARTWVSFKWFRLRYKLYYSPLFQVLLALPGRAFFRELFGRSKALPDDRMPQLHLSDGGHFENLALYELIRRHLRYIIVSDAGQDQDVAFDDLGNAIRRVREDFGVEIEIDLSPIRPNAQLESPQHIVIGTIHYDGFEGSDKGTLLYIKPTITGDEPGDIQQYRSRNRIFPHEPTSDQFFSEAQWESYRRLGEHVGQVTFGFLDLMSPAQRARPETIFRQLHSAWSPLPADVRVASEGVAAKFCELDADFAKLPRAVRAEIWPEAEGTAEDANTGATTEPDETLLLPYLARIIQLMEETWHVLRLDEFWSHTANVGVMNRFRRWWGSQTLRRWWVILSPLCSSEFREFVRINFKVDRSSQTAKPHADTLESLLQFRRVQDPATIQKGLAWRQLQSPPDLSGKTVFELVLRLEEGPPERLLQVALAFVTLTDEQVQSQVRRVARWQGYDLFVPDALAGSGFKSRLLDGLIKTVREEGVNQICVDLLDEFPGRRDEAAREARLNLIGFYKSRNFVITPTAHKESFAELYLELKR